MKRGLVLCAVLALAALLVTLISRCAEPTPQASELAPAPALTAQPPRDGDVLAQANELSSIVVAREELPPAVKPAIESLPAPAPTPAPQRDTNAHDVVHLVLQDRFGVAVPNAEVRLTGLRTNRSPGSHWGLGDEGGVSRSNPDGTVTLSFPVWVNADLETSLLTLVIHHPDFEAKELDNFKIGPEPRVIVLERGAFLVVSGYIGEPSAIVRDVTPHLTDDVDVPSDSWLPIKDGRLSNSRIPAGYHGIFLEHRASDGTRHYSETMYFELGREEQKELHLALVSARTIQGFLDNIVPRPIRDGGVIYCFQVSEPSRRASIFETYRAPVNADGTFKLEGLPPGSGQIIGMCEGWVSKRVPGTAEDLAIDSTDPAEIERQMVELGNDAWIPQSIDAHTGEPFELAMEPSVTLTAVLVDPDKKPVAGARLNLWPNVFWKSGSSQVFMSKSYMGISDEQGRVRIENLPTGFCGYQAVHLLFEMPMNERGQRSRHLDLASGSAEEMVIEMVRRE